MADPCHVHNLILNSPTPVVLRGLIDWPILKFTARNWDEIFKNKLLECRVGMRSCCDDEPQWENRSIIVQCTYPKLVQWTKEPDSNDNENELSTFHPNKHFLYFGYKYMKDVFGDQLLEMIDWGRFGFPGLGGRESTFWLGTAGAHTPCHYDTYGCNLVAQISGRKRWVLYPPEDTKYLQPTRVPYEESSVYSGINFEKWPDSVPPIESTHPYVVELVPGDVLYVPRHWWHYVRNEELSISINTWLVLPEMDEESRLHEALVKFFVAHTCRNVSSSEVLDLLNPNEEELVNADLEEIQGYVQQSLLLKRQIVKRSNSASTNDIQGNEWCVRLLPAVLPQSDSQGPRAPPSSCSTLDVIRAFSDPRVIQLVADILENVN